VLIDHRRRLYLALELQKGASGSEDKGACSLPEAPLSLDHPKTSLRDIAAHLLAPACSGLTLTRDELRHISHAHQSPAGFGPRQTMLHNVLQSAVEYDQLPQVVPTLLARCETWREMYHGLIAQELPSLTRISRVWLARLDATCELLEQIGQESAALASRVAAL